MGWTELLLSPDEYGDRKVGDSPINGSKTRQDREDDPPQMEVAYSTLGRVYLANRNLGPMGQLEYTSIKKLFP